MYNHKVQRSVVCTTIRWMSTEKCGFVPWSRIDSSSATHCPILILYLKLYSGKQHCSGPCMSHDFPTKSNCTQRLGS